MIHKLNIGGVAWAYARIFERSRYRCVTCNPLRIHFEVNPQISQTKEAEYQMINVASYSGENHFFAYEYHVNIYAEARQFLLDYVEAMI